MTDETYTEAETDARREAALKRMLATPHKPHKSGRTEVDYSDSLLNTPNSSALPGLGPRFCGFRVRPVFASRASIH